MNVNEETIDGMTALHNAVHYRNYKAVSALINVGANVNTICSDGSTPLSSAIIASHTDSDSKMIKELIDAGAKLNMISRNGKTCFRTNLLESHLKKLIKHSLGGSMVNETTTSLHLAAQTGYEFLLNY